jgi:GNS1/SUR4 family
MSYLAINPSVFSIWRPDFPESIDRQPLASNVSELFFEFQYDRLPSHPLINALMRPYVVLLLLALYLVSKKPIGLMRDKIGIDPKSSTFRNFIAIHNFTLAVFSGICAWNSWRIVLQHWIEYGFMAVYCDVDGSLWKNGLGAWSTIFYISKYYEFVDTWILVLKGKPASFLQVYHHTGIAFIMWAAVASQSSWLLFAVLLNSFIHTLMYTYFFVKTISPQTEIKVARYLTMAQITQFLIGIVCTIGIFFLGSSCCSQSSRFALACLHIYGFGLIALFASFASRKYKKK